MPQACAFLASFLCLRKGLRETERTEDQHRLGKGKEKNETKQKAYSHGSPFGSRAYGRAYGLRFPAIY